MQWGDNWCENDNTCWPYAVRIYIHNHFLLFSIKNTIRSLEKITNTEIFLKFINKAIMRNNAFKINWNYASILFYWKLYWYLILLLHIITQFLFFFLSFFFSHKFFSWVTFFGGLIATNCHRNRLICYNNKCHCNKSRRYRFFLL